MTKEQTSRVADRLGCDKRFKIKGYSPNHWMSRCRKGIFLCGKCSDRKQEKIDFELSKPKDFHIGNRWFGGVKSYRLNIHFIPFEVRELKDFITSIKEEAEKQAYAEVFEAFRKLSWWDEQFEESITHLKEKFLGKVTG